MNYFKSPDLETKIIPRNERRKKRSEDWKRKYNFDFPDQEALEFY